MTPSRVTVFDGPLAAVCLPPKLRYRISWIASECVVIPEQRGDGLRSLPRSGLLVRNNIRLARPAGLDNVAHTQSVKTSDAAILRSFEDDSIRSRLACSDVSRDDRIIVVF